MTDEPNDTSRRDYAAESLSASARARSAQDRLATEIRRRRDLAGLSQAQLADRIGYTRQYVSRAERRVGGLVSADLVRVIDDALGAGGALARLHANLQAQQTASRTPPPAPGTRGTLVEVAVRSPTGFRGPDQATNIDEEIALAAEEASRFVRSAATGGTPELVEQLHADVRRLAIAYLARPPFQMFRPLAALRAEVFELLDQHPRLDVRRDLYAVGGRVSALLAHVSSDLGHPYAADSHARTAWLCADLAGDRKLGSYTRWIQSNVAYWSGDHATAADIAGTARSLADDLDDHIRLTSQEARARAASGDQAATYAALSTVATLREQARSDRTPKAPGVFHFGPGKAAYYASEAQLTLGGTSNVRGAIADARDAVAVLTHDTSGGFAVELVAAARLDLAAALLASRELEAAVDEIDAILTTPTESRTVPIISRVCGIGSVVTRQFSDTPAASELGERIRLFAAHPAARELPTVPDIERS